MSIASATLWAAWHIVLGFAAAFAPSLRLVLLDTAIFMATIVSMACDINMHHKSAN